MKYVFLALAIICEVFGSSMMKASEQFTKLVPSVLTFVGFGFCFYFLSQTLKSIPLGIAYGIWAGVGIVLTAIVSVVVFKQRLDAPAIVGMGFIIVGVLIINFLSRSASH